MVSFLTDLKHFFFARKEVQRYFSASNDVRNIVFYSEDVFSYIHFEALISELINIHKRKVTYLTSAIDDPLLNNDTPNLNVFYIGAGVVRTAFFMKLKANVIIMTMPDMETFHIKRSRIATVHYVYVFHAMVSTHSNYRKGAFDHFDTIFLSGFYQENEIRATERLYKLPKKSLIEYGYPRLESLLSDVKQWREKNVPPEGSPPHIIVAPTWGDTAILETIGEPLIHILLDAGFIVTVRPHPVTTIRRKDVISNLQNIFSENKNFFCETDTRNKSTLYNADLMICDWSGVAMEYAFACERPIIYINVPQKLKNPEADKIEIVPIERSIRDKIGIIISPDNLKELPELVLESIKNRNQFLSEIIRLRNEYVFNLNSSITVGAKHIARIADGNK